jgi:hypothetical protein
MIHRCLIAAGIALALSCPALAGTPEQAERLALSAAEKAVPKALKNPKSAEFDRDSVLAEPLGNWLPDVEAEVYKVTGVVRATNSFNAVVPSTWTAYVVDEGDTAFVSVLKLDNDVIGRGVLSFDIQRKLMDEERVVIEAARVAQEKGEAASRARQEEMRKRQADLEELRIASQKLERARDAGRSAGQRMVSAMGPAASRLTAKDAEKRAKKEALRLRVEDQDVEPFIDGYVSGALAAKPRKPAN